MTTDLKQIRELYNKCPFEENKCKELIKVSENVTDPVILGYHLTGKIIGCKYISNPFKRMAPFSESKLLLEELISENFDEVELRYMRYAIQRQAPKILGYYKNLETDMKVLISYIKENPNSDLTNHMMVYLKDTKDRVLELI